MGPGINYAGELWALTFMASFALSAIAGAIQQFREKELLDLPFLSILMVLHLAWLLPILAPLFAIWATFAGLGWLRGRTIGQAKMSDGYCKKWG